MAGVLAGFATGAATSALALSAVSLLGSGHLPGPNPPAPPVEELRASVRPGVPDAAAVAPTPSDADPYVRPGAPTDEVPSADVNAPTGGEPAAAPKPALGISPPVRPPVVPDAVDAETVSLDPFVPTRMVPAMPEPGRGSVVENKTLVAPTPPDEEVERFDASQPPDVEVPTTPQEGPIESSPAAVIEPVEPVDEPAAAIAAEPATNLQKPATDQPPAGTVLLEPAPVPAQVKPELNPPETDTAVADQAAGDDSSFSPAGTSVQFKQVTPSDPVSSVDGVVTNRLPQIGGTPEVPEAPETATDEPEPDEADVQADGGSAIVTNAAEFAPQEGRPAIGILLRDVPPRMTPEELAAFALPATFVVDVNDSDAEEAISFYRAAGYEVALSGDLPQGATSSDAETTVEDWLRRFPDAVAFVEGRAGGLQPSREAVQGVVSRLGESGHGLVTFPRGLNAAQQVAGAEDVPVALLFRDITGAGDLPRLMDQAAFRASREPDVLVIGDATPEMLEAFTDWASSTSAARVQAAPVSYVLTTDGTS